MQMRSASPPILPSGTAPLSTGASRALVGRPIVREGIAVRGRVSSLLRISALVLLLIAILAD